jgi:hypothetical protein
LSRLKFRDLSGRGEVEKYIKLLIAADKEGQAENTSYFIFDRDNKPSGLQSTKNVKVSQWGRYCLENYLIEPSILYDTVKNDLKPKNWPSTFSEADQFFQGLAKKQLRTVIVDQVYKELGPPDSRIKSEERKADFGESAKLLYAKVENLREHIVGLQMNEWTKKFVEKCEEKLAKEEPEWNSKWMERCSGKVFLQDVYGYAAPKADLSTLKRTLLGSHKLLNSESWQLLRATLQNLTDKLN